MTRPPTVDQLRNLADRAATGLSADEQQRLRDGLDALHAERADAWQKFATVAAQRDRLRLRMNALADRWVKAGPPPLGTPLARWWDKRLIELNAALDEPAPATPATGLRHTVAAQVDTHTWTGNQTATTAWLAGHPHHLDGTRLVIDTIDGPVPAPHGYLLARWPDGDITVMSPRAAAKRLHPAAPTATEATGQTN